ncbi:type 1 fimbrial protein [Serratia nevei]|uniref:fimbrial protein n=1 Tax=Serratia nevei TaxID=2703794 RepID=UPI0020A08A70|nr:fimbrial protein [Serratia nevei]MCP1107100.1 type 1 fimbrial protein [Serratia nevei]
MKKYVIASALACATLSISAIAADGVINFTGRIIDNTCVVNPTLNVQMGDVAAAEFKNVGEHAPAREFFLELKDCPASIKTASVQLEGAADTHNKDLFQLASGGATGLALWILTTNGVKQDVVPGGTSEAFSLTEGANLLSFAAAYKSTDKVVTAGDANASIQFSILYN